MTWLKAKHTDKMKFCVECAEFRKQKISHKFWNALRSFRSQFVVIFDLLSWRREEKIEVNTKEWNNML